MVEASTMTANVDFLINSDSSPWRLDFGCLRAHTRRMNDSQPTEAELEREHSSMGATEDNVDMKDTVPQRVDKKGTKVEDEAGTGKHDAAGG